jgi:CRP-like cAMP-binding protein
MAIRSGSKYVSALRQHDLRTLVIAFVTDGAPTWCYNVVLISYVFDRTNSAAPDYVGELGLVHRRPRTATVATVTECQMLRIPGQDFLAAIEDTPPSSMMLGRAGVRMARTTPRADQLWA